MTNKEQKLLLNSIGELFEEKLDGMFEMKLDRLFEEKFDKVLETKLDRLFEEKLDKVLETKLDRLFEEKLDKVLETKLDMMFEDKLDKVLEQKLDRMFEQKLEPRFRAIEERLDRLENDVQFIKLELENNIRPRLSQIESCYCSTFDRYRSENNKIQGTYIEFDALKDVVQKHSLQIKELQELAGISAN